MGGTMGSATAGPIYLDHNATAPADPRVLEAMAPWWGEGLGNSRSLHAPGRRASAAIEAARAHCAALVGGRLEGVIFTSGGSEAANLAVKGLAWAHGPEPKDRLWHSALEHSCVRRSMQFLTRFGFHEAALPVDAQGHLVLESLDEALAPHDALLVAVQAANNEIGTRQDLPEVARRVRAAGAHLLVDAAQGAGKLPLEVEAWGIDLLSVAGHKLHGPQGVGFLHRQAHVVLEPLIHGAGHEGDRRSGTHPVALIVGLGEACRLAKEELEAGHQGLQALRDRLEARLRAGHPGLLRHGDPAACTPHLLSVSFPGLVGQDLLEACPELAATTGAACHSGSTRPSEAMVAIGASLEAAAGTVRLSLGRHTTEAMVDEAAAALLRAANRLMPGS